MHNFLLKARGYSIFRAKYVFSQREPSIFRLRYVFFPHQPKNTHKRIRKHRLRAKKWKIGAKKHVLKRLGTCFYDVFLQAAGWGSSGEGGKGDRVNPIPRRVLTRPIPPKVGSTDFGLFRPITAYLEAYLVEQIINLRK